MASVFTVDGESFPNIHVTSLKRNFSVTDGENAGRVLTGRMERDLIGTFYNYTVELDPDGASVAEYDQLYEMLSAPQDYHTIVMPYGQTTLTFEAYVTNGSDELSGVYDGVNLWGNLQFNFIAMQPQRYVE